MGQESFEGLTGRAAPRSPNEPRLFASHSANQLRTVCPEKCSPLEKLTISSSSFRACDAVRRWRRAFPAALSREKQNSSASRRSAVFVDFLSHRPSADWKWLDGRHPLNLTEDGRLVDEDGRPAHDQALGLWKRRPAFNRRGCAQYSRVIECARSLRSDFISLTLGKVRTREF